MVSAWCEMDVATIHSMSTWSLKKKGMGMTRILSLEKRLCRNTSEMDLSHPSTGSGTSWAVGTWHASEPTTAEVPPQPQEELLFPWPGYGRPGLFLVEFEGKPSKNSPAPGVLTGDHLLAPGASLAQQTLAQKLAPSSWGHESQQETDRVARK